MAKPMLKTINIVTDIVRAVYLGQIYVIISFFFLKIMNLGSYVLKKFDDIITCGVIYSQTVYLVIV